MVTRLFLLACVGDFLRACANALIYTFFPLRGRLEPSQRIYQEKPVYKNKKQFCINQECTTRRSDARAQLEP